MKNKLIIICMIFVLIFTMISCVDGKNSYEKNTDATLKSDNDDYIVPDIYVDVQQGEHHDGGEQYGEYVGID